MVLDSHWMSVRGELISHCNQLPPDKHFLIEDAMFRRS